MAGRLDDDEGSALLERSELATAELVGVEVTLLLPVIPISMLDDDSKVLVGRDALELVTSTDDEILDVVV